MHTTHYMSKFHSFNFFYIIPYYCSPLKKKKKNTIQRVVWKMRLTLRIFRQFVIQNMLFAKKSPFNKNDNRREYLNNQQQKKRHGWINECMLGGYY